MKGAAPGGGVGRLAHLWRSTRLYAQQRESLLESGTLVHSGANDRVESCQQ